MYGGIDTNMYRVQKRTSFKSTINEFVVAEKLLTIFGAHSLYKEKNIWSVSHKSKILKKATLSMLLLFLKFCQFKSKAERSFAFSRVILLSPTSQLYLDNDSNNGLKGHDYDSLRALCCRRSGAIPRRRKD